MKKWGLSVVVTQDEFDGKAEFTVSQHDGPTVCGSGYDSFNMALLDAIKMAKEHLEDKEDSLGE